MDAHFHLDATLSPGRPRLNRSGTLLEGIQIWAEQKPPLTEEDVTLRARGPSGRRWRRCLRTHVDTCDLGRAARALVRLREGQRLLRPQICRFPRWLPASPSRRQALDRGARSRRGRGRRDPHFERTTAAGDDVALLRELAAERGLRVDMHCDETDDPQSRHVDPRGADDPLRARGAGQRLTRDFAPLRAQRFRAKLIPLLAEAQVCVIANPLINITLQGRRDTYPKCRGMTPLGWREWSTWPLATTA